MHIYIYVNISLYLARFELIFAAIFNKLIFMMKVKNIDLVWLNQYQSCIPTFVFYEIVMIRASYIIQRMTVAWDVSNIVRKYTFEYKFTYSVTSKPDPCMYEHFCSARKNVIWDNKNVNNKIV